MSVPADRFDEVRRRWIARHQHTFIFQKRRAELLARQIRDRAAENSGARVDPADDDVIHPLIARPVKTIYAGVDMAIVCTAALLAPLGWMAGKAIYRMLVQLIPGELRSYPVAACMWAAVVGGHSAGAAVSAHRLTGRHGAGAVAAGAAARGTAGRRHLRHPGGLAGRRRGPRLVADAPTTGTRRDRLRA